jgi:LPS sulfotransferase NodH
MPIQQRSKKYRKNEKLEALLKEINTYFEPIEEQRIAVFARPKNPVVFITGSPRSGTTLVMQFLSQTGKFGYPSNFISRFYNAPYWGVQLQNLLTHPKYDFNKEFFDLQPTHSFSSYLGKTQGLLAPNEFWYFWRRFFYFPQNSNQMSPEFLSSVDTALICRELSAMEDAFGKPLVFKGMMMNWNLDFMLEMLDGKAIFVFIEREPAYNVQSLLKARQSFWTSYETWYSFKPPEYKELIRFDAVKQVAGQIHYTNKAIRESLEAMPRANRIFLQYETFCQSPTEFLQTLSDSYRELGASHDMRFGSYESFTPTNTVRVSSKRWESILEAVDFFLKLK